MWKHLQVLPLVLVNALHQHVEERRRRDRDAGALGDERGEPALVRELHLAPSLLELGIVGEWFELSESIEILQPAVADPRMISCVRLGLLTATKRRGVTPLVTLQNFSGHSSAKSRSTVCFSNSEWS